jgi:hypothetical protein
MLDGHPFSDARVTGVRSCQQRWLTVLALVPLAATILVPRAFAQAQGPAATTAQVTRAAGTIKSVQVDSITLTSDSGAEVTAQFSSSTRILRVPAGQKDLKSATPIQAQDLQSGDRVLVRGSLAPDGHSIAALAVIVMKQSDVLAKREQEREDWQRHGVGGLVSTVDVAGGNITISTGGFAKSRTVVVHTGKETVLRRYPPGSVRFDEAKPAPLDQIKPGDQLWARGMRSEDGSQLTAEEIVSGTFRNIAGIITALDASGNSLTVQDVIGKSTVVVKISPDSQMKKLPPEMAQRIAMRLKAEETGEQASGLSNARPLGEAMAHPPSRIPGPPGAMREGPRNGAPDFQRLLSRLPSSALADLQKGDAVMIVATSRGEREPLTAIKLLAGVEPILTAAPNRSASMMLSPWTLGSSNAEAATEP